MGKLWDGIESIGKGIGDVTEDVYKGGADALKGGWEWAKDVPGQVNREMGRGLEKMGVGGKLADDPLESIGAAVGTIIGGMYALPAMGVGAAAGSAGAAGAGAAGAGAGAGATGLASSMGAGASGLTFTGLGGGGAATATGVGTGATYTGTLGSLGTTIGSYTAPVMETMSQYGGMLDYASQGLDLYNAATGGQQQAPQAPAFRPSFQRSNSTGMADQLMQQEMQGGYGQLNINQYR